MTMYLHPDMRRAAMKIRDIRPKSVFAWLTHGLCWEPNAHRRRRVSLGGDPYEFCSPGCPYCAEREGFIDGVSPELREMLLEEIK